MKIFIRMYIVHISYIDSYQDILFRSEYKALKFIKRFKISADFENIVLYDIPKHYLLNYSKNNSMEELSFFYCNCNVRNLYSVDILKTVTKLGRYL